MMRRLPVIVMLWVAAMSCTIMCAAAAPITVTVQMRIAFNNGASSHSAAPAVVWLKALQPTAQISFPAHGRYTLLQKNRMFTPHLLVIPVGSVVAFPNADPFFHNVFSLFDGKRFDLGLYEAGSTREVTFSREGVSYIFCNIHPEMSAVILALTTPLYSTKKAGDAFEIRNVPAGEYELHVWVEGVPQSILDTLTRPVSVGPGNEDLGTLNIAATPIRGDTHLNKFGQPYDRDSNTSY